MSDESELLAAAQEVIALWDSDRLTRDDDFASFMQRVVDWGARSDTAKARLRAAVDALAPSPPVAAAPHDTPPKGEG